MGAAMKLDQTPAWTALAAHAFERRSASIIGLFGETEKRLAAFSFDLGGIYIDFSKLNAAPHTLELLAELAKTTKLTAWRDRLFSGDIVNLSEARSATHIAERGSGAVADVAQAAQGRAQMAALVARVRGSSVRHIIHIGIGGSALGPALLLDALGSDGDGPECHIVSNIDGLALARALAECDPTATMLVLVSKTFGTTETMTNAATAIDWLARAGIADPLVQCIAVTAAPARAAAFGVRADNILPFAESVGGRYSLWSAVGLPLALRCGWDSFAALLEGAAAMDRHFAQTPFAANAPMLAGALDVWAATFLKIPARAVFAYDERLRMLPAYLQQLEMESNGKQVSRDGEPLGYATAAITWGGTGTDAQHAVFQLLHQGTAPTTTEFVAVIEAGDHLPATHHRQLLGNCFAQGAALLAGRSMEEALRLTDGDTALAAAKTFPGNRPSATLLLDRLDAHRLGQLLAFYEHRTFVAATLLGINPFDQWGVELGKEMAGQIDNGSDFDPSTNALIARAGV